MSSAGKARDGTQLRCQPPPEVVRVAIAGSLLYAALCLALVIGIPEMPFASDRISRLLIGIVVSVVGPAVVFTAGLEGWKWFAATLLLVFGFLRLACRLWHRFPDEEWFVLALVAAAVIWISSGWFLALVSAV